MSWQPYVEMLTAEGLTAAAILSDDGKVVLAASPGFSLQPGEGQALAALFENPSDVFAKGIQVGGVMYFGVKGQAEEIQGRKRDTGVAAAKTNQTMVLGVHDGRFQPGNAMAAVNRMAESLRNWGY